MEWLFSEWIILRTGGETWYNYFYTTYINVYLAHHEMFRAKGGKGGIMSLSKFVQIIIQG